MPSFINIRQHAPEYLGIESLENIAQQLKESGAQHFPLLMHGSLSALEKHHETARAHGLLPISAVALPVTLAERLNNSLPAQYQQQKYGIVAIIKNQQGYENLCKIISTNESENNIQNGAFCRNKIRIDDEWVQGIQFTFGGAESPFKMLFDVWGNEALPLSRDLLTAFKRKFGNESCLELIDTGNTAADNAYNHFISQLASMETNGATTPLICSQDSIFRLPEHYDLAKKVAQVRQTHAPLLLSDNAYFKDGDTLNDVFANYPKAVAHTSELLGQMAQWQPEKSPNLLPSWTGAHADDVAALRSLAFDGLEKRLTEQFDFFNSIKEQHNNTLPSMSRRAKYTIFMQQMSENGGKPRETDMWAEYEARLNNELAVIEDKQFSSYFLMVADYVNHAKESGIAVGAGRGSGAGALLSYALGISEVDALHYNLYFERFINPARNGLPDIDVDFDATRIDDVIGYLKDKYGENRVLGLATFTAYQSKSAIEAAARAYGYRNNSPETLALKRRVDEKDENENSGSLNKPIENEYKIMELANVLQGLPNGRGIHASGVALLPDFAVNQFPTFKDHENKRGLNNIIAFDKDDAEKQGVVKFDLLALATLSVNAEIMNLAEQNGQDMSAQRKGHFDWYDKSVYQNIFQKADLLGIFQCESPTMRRLFANLQPTNLEQIAFLTALGRPATLGLVDDVFDVRHQRKPMVYISDKLQTPLSQNVKNLFNETFGIMIYQEQVMELLKEVGGFSLSEADNIRRSLSKKNHDEIAKQRDKFVNGAVDKYLSELGDKATPEQGEMRRQDANIIFDYVEKFAGYGFNKSHAIAYAKIIYQQAWFKQHCPEAFFAATLNHFVANNERHLVSDCINNAVAHGVSVVAPNINQSEKQFTVKNVGDSLSLIEPLGSRGTNGKLIDKILTVRPKKANGEYAIQSFDDLMNRLNLATLNNGDKITLNNLIQSGVFDETDGKNARARLSSSLNNPKALPQVSPTMKLMADMQNTLRFSLSPELLAAVAPPPDATHTLTAPKTDTPMPIGERANQDFATKGYAYDSVELNEIAQSMSDTLGNVMIETGGSLLDKAQISSWQKAVGSLEIKIAAMKHQFQENPTHARTNLFDKETAMSWGFVYMDNKADGKRNLKACLFGRNDDGSISCEKVDLLGANNNSNHESARALYLANEKQLPLYQPLLLSLTVQAERRILPTANAPLGVNTWLEDVYTLQELSNKGMALSLSGSLKDDKETRLLLAKFSSDNNSPDTLSLQHQDKTLNIKVNELSVAHLAENGLHIKAEIAPELLHNGLFQHRLLGGAIAPFETVAQNEITPETHPALSAIVQQNPQMGAWRNQDLLNPATALPSSNYLVLGQIDEVSETAQGRKRISFRLPNAENEQVISTFFADNAHQGALEKGDWAVFDVDLARNRQMSANNYLTVRAAYSESDIGVLMWQNCESESKNAERLREHLNAHIVDDPQANAPYTLRVGNETLRLAQSAHADLMDLAQETVITPRITPNTLDGSAQQFNETRQQWLKKSAHFVKLDMGDNLEQVFANRPEYATVNALVLDKKHGEKDGWQYTKIEIGDDTHRLNIFLPDNAPEPEIGDYGVFRLYRNKQGDYSANALLSPEQALSAHVAQCNLSGSLTDLEKAKQFLSELPRTQSKIHYAFADEQGELKSVQAASSPEIIKALREIYNVKMTLSYRAPDKVFYPSNQELQQIQEHVQCHAHAIRNAGEFANQQQMNRQDNSHATPSQ